MVRGSPTDPTAPTPGGCRCLLGLLATWLMACLVSMDSAPQPQQEPGCSHALSLLQPLPSITAITQSRHRHSSPCPQTRNRILQPPSAPGHWGHASTSYQLTCAPQTAPPSPPTLPAVPLLLCCRSALRLSFRLTGQQHPKRGEAHSFPTPTGSSCLLPQGNPMEQDHDPWGSCLRPCPARSARSTHSPDAALRGGPSARMLPSFTSWRTLVVHALAAGWAEPGGSSVTVLLGLRRTKTSVSPEMHGLTPVPSPSQKSHPPPVFPCPRSLQAHSVREGSSRDTPAPKSPDTRCITTCQVQSTFIPSISHRHSSPPALPGSPCAPAFLGNTLSGADPRRTHQKDWESPHREPAMQRRVVSAPQSCSRARGRGKEGNWQGCMSIPGFSRPAPSMAMDS